MLSITHPDRTAALSPQLTAFESAQSQPTIVELEAGTTWSAIPEQLVTIVVLVGAGQLRLETEAVLLEPGMGVLLPAHTAYTLCPHSPLNLLVVSCEADGVASESVWVFSF